MTKPDRQSWPIVVFATSQPDGTVTAHVDPDRSIDDVPTWSLQTVNAGPSRGSSEYPQHLDDTVGSSFDWSDEIRFDKRTGELRSFILKMPEAGEVDAAIARSWISLPRQCGIPVLDAPEVGFHIDPLDLRYLAPDGSALLATDGEIQLATSDSLRLAIGNDIDLLFEHGRYRGWILGKPARHLVAEPGETAPLSDEPQLQEPLHDYLGLVVEPHITRMNDEDPEMREALQSLRARVRDIEGPGARVLLGAIERVPRRLLSHIVAKKMTSTISSKVTMSESPALEPLDHEAIHKILAEHERCRASHGAEGQEADFSYNIIQNFDFSGMNLWGVHFQGAVLEGCRFRSTVLYDADFGGVSAPNTDFSGADLVRVGMSDSVLRDCCFDNCNLGGAHFYSADLTRASFRHADLTGAGISESDLTNAVFDSACIDWATIENNQGSGSSWLEMRGKLGTGALPA